MVVLEIGISEFPSGDILLRDTRESDECLTARIHGERLVPSG